MNETQNAWPLGGEVGVRSREVERCAKYGIIFRGCGERRAEMGYRRCKGVLNYRTEGQVWLLTAGKRE